MAGHIIDAGSSGSGWSKIGKVLGCAQNGAFATFGDQTHKLIPTDKPPLIKGSLLHVGTAQFHAIQQAHQQGWDASIYEDPIAALHITAQKADAGRAAASLLGTWVPHVALVEGALRQYMADWPGYKILDVEKWVVGWFTPDGIVEAPHDADARLAAALASDFEAMRAFGLPYPMTSRLDWAMGVDGGIGVVDTKSASGRINIGKREGYAMSGQLLAMDWMARHIWKDKYRGLSISFVELPSGNAWVEPVGVAPFALECFPQTVCDSWEAFFRMAIDEKRDLYRYPKALHETICIHRYGRCEFYDRCRYGK